MGHDKFSRAMGLSGPMRLLTRLLRRDIDLEVPVGLERDGKVLLKPYSPPYYPSMREAVIAFVNDKYRPETGWLRDPIAGALWQDAPAIQAQIPRASHAAVAATIAFCEYVHDRFGRFPATNGPYRTVTAYQAMHLDPAFYSEFYTSDALSPTQRDHPRH